MRAGRSWASFHVKRDPAPRRLALGKDAYDRIGMIRTERLAAPVRVLRRS